MSQRKGFGKNLAVILWLLGLAPVWAADVTILPPTGLEGFAGVSGWVNTGTILYVGDVNSSDSRLRTVLKFPLSGITKAGYRATLTAYCTYVTSSPFYFVLEHYTYQNNTSLGLNDAITTQVERIGGVINAGVAAYEWDVTGAVRADQQAGWSHSSFRLIQTDEAGNYITSNNGTARAVCFDSQEYGDPSRAPALHISYPGQVVVSGSVGLSGYTVENQWLWLGNVSSANHLFRGILKFPIQAYSQPVTSANLYAFCSYLVVPSGQTANYFVVEHYTVENNVYLIPEDATSTQVERISGVETAQITHTYSWNVASYVEQDRAAGRTHSAFRFALTDAVGNYLTDTGGQVRCIYFDNNCRLVASTSSWPATLSRGHKILLDRGLQIQAQTFPVVTDSFDLTRWQSSNFTTVNFQWEQVPHFLGTAPGSLWGWWIHPDSSEMVSEVLPYLSNLVGVQVNDEQGVSDPLNIPRLQELRDKVPHALSYTNQCSVRQIPPSTYRQYLIDAQPDMIMFDQYVIDFTPGGSPTVLYEAMQVMRQYGLSGLDGTGNTPIPYAQYIQTFTGLGFNHVFSDSEMRLSEFASWAFGYKFISAYVYESPNVSGMYSTLFTGLGDANPTSAFTQIAETNRQSRNLGPALVRLISTDVRMKMGRHHGPRNHWYEIGVGPWEVDNTLPTGVSAWSTSADPYITGVSASNTGNCNTYTKDDLFSSWTVRLPGDVVLGFFKPIHESFDGTNYASQKYFMIVNGLSDGVGDTVAARQQITVDFNFGSSGITGLQRMRRSDGVVENIVVGGSYSGLTWTNTGTHSYRLVLSIDGGTGDLFKYNTGAPFVGTPGQL